MSTSARRIPRPHRIRARAMGLIGAAVVATAALATTTGAQAAWWSPWDRTGSSWNRVNSSWRDLGDTPMERIAGPAFGAAQDVVVMTSPGQRSVRFSVMDRGSRCIPMFGAAGMTDLGPLRSGSMFTATAFRDSNCRIQDSMTVVDEVPWGRDGQDMIVDLTR